MITYRITSIVSMGNSLPAPIITTLFPNFDGWPCTMSSDGFECIVTAPSPQTPVDLGPLVKVEVVEPLS